MHEPGYVKFESNCRIVLLVLLLSMRESEMGDDKKDRQRGIYIKMYSLNKRCMQNNKSLNNFSYKNNNDS